MSFKSFQKNYWNTNYSEPSTMDGISNAKDHAKYIQSIFKLEQIKINSIVDLGFGMGKMYNEIIHQLKPQYALGIEPSEYIYKKYIPLKDYACKTQNIDIKNWLKKSAHQKMVYDLGICNSVFQYISDQDLEFIIKECSKRFRYLYLTVPTNKEYDRQRQDENFQDPFATIRSKSFYFKKISPHFSFISFRILESKYYYNYNNSPFTDHLYRF